MSSDPNDTNNKQVKFTSLQIQAPRTNGVAAGHHSLADREETVDYGQKSRLTDQSRTSIASPPGHSQYESFNSPNHDHDHFESFNTQHSPMSPDSDALSPFPINSQLQHEANGFASLNLNGGGEEKFNYHSHSRKTSAAVAPHSPEAAHRLTAAIVLLTKGETFDLFTTNEPASSPAASTLTGDSLPPTTLTRLYVSPIERSQLTHADTNGAISETVDVEHLALFWHPVDQPKSHESIPLEQLTDVWKGAASAQLRKAITTNSNWKDEEFLILESDKHTLSLHALSRQIRDSWIDAVCTVLELSLHKSRIYFDASNQPILDIVVTTPSSVHHPQPTLSTATAISSQEALQNGVSPRETDPTNSPAPVLTIAPVPAEQPQNAAAVSSSSSSSLSTPAAAPTTINMPPDDNITVTNVVPARKSSFTVPIQPAPEPTEKELETIVAMATEKAQLVHDIRLTLAEMVQGSTEMLRKEFSVNGTPTPQPSPKEFEGVLKVKSKNFTQVKAAQNESFESKAYAPTIFSRIRQFYGINDDVFLASVAHPTKGYNDLIVNSKSGSFFFYSHDNRYLLKSCTVEENKMLCETMLVSYYHHLHQYPDSLLIKIFGSFRLVMKRPHRQTLHFFIMRNVFLSPPSKPIHVRFDLKGSTYGRKAKETELAQPVPVLKDIDFFDGVTFPDGRKLPPTFLHLGEKRKVLLKQLAIDAEYLRKNSVMDFSLLVGIHYKDADKDKNAAGTSQPVAASSSAAATPAADDPSSVAASSSSSAPKQTNYGVKPQKEVVIPRQLLRKATMVFLSDAEREEIHAIANASPQPSMSQKSRHKGNAGGHARHVSLLLESDGGILSSSKDPAHDGNETYYLGVIDILQRYTAFKRVERTFKSITLSPAEISCAEPYFYAERFMTRLTKHFLGDDDANGEVANMVKEEDDAEEFSSGTSGPSGAATPSSKPAAAAPATQGKK